MAGLYLGSSPVALGGASRLYYGAEQIWPGVPLGPSFDAFTVHAWDPQSGADANGQIADAVGSAILRAVTGATPIANWGGAINDSATALIVDAADIAAFNNLAQVTLTFWMQLDSGSGAYAPVVAQATDAISTGAEGGFELRRNGSTAMQFRVRSSYTAGVKPTFDPGTGWRFYAIRLGASQWRAIFEGGASGDLSWLSQVRPNLGRGLSFANYAPSLVSYLDDADSNVGFRGQFGDIRLHNKTLSTAEITALFEAGRQSY